MNTAPSGRRTESFAFRKTVARGANPNEETYCRFNRLMEWIEDHKYTKGRKEGWFDVLRYQARLHARHARVMDYWHNWEAQSENHPIAEYPAFTKWHDAAHRYTIGVNDA